jgi:hypothetical protein
MRQGKLILTLASVLGALTGWAVIAKLMRAEHHPWASALGIIAALTVAVLWESLLELLDDRDGVSMRWHWIVRMLRIAIVLMVLETIVGASEMLGEAAEDYSLIRQIGSRHIGGLYSAPLLPVYIGRIVAISLGWAVLPALLIFSFAAGRLQGTRSPWAYWLWRQRSSIGASRTILSFVPCFWPLARVGL